METHTTHNEMKCIHEGWGTDCGGEVYLQNWTPMCPNHVDENQERVRAQLKALTVREDYHF